MPPPSIGSSANVPARLLSDCCEHFSANAWMIYRSQLSHASHLRIGNMLPPGGVFIRIPYPNMTFPSIRSRHALLQGWPNYGSRAASGPPTSLTRPANYIAHFFKHHLSGCEQQCNSIGCCLSLVDLSPAAAVSCKQR